MENRKNRRMIYGAAAAVLVILIGTAAFLLGRYSAKQENAIAAANNGQQTEGGQTPEESVSHGESTEEEGSALVCAEETTQAGIILPDETEETTAWTAGEAPQPPAAGGDSPFAAHGRLSVTGTQLTDEAGNAFQLRGVSTHGIGWFPQYVNYDTFAELRGWGANGVRIAMYTGEGGYCQTDEAGRQKLRELVDTGVQAATELGMYVIIDWHILSDGNPNTYSDMAEAFFREMSEKYKDYGNVLYEICNEPNGGVSWSEIKSYAQKIIPVIRENAPDAIIIVGTPTWSQDVDIAAQDPITDWSNIMYTLHFYADTHRESLRNKLSSALAAGLPVMVTEFGICDASGNGSNNTAEGNTWIDVLDGCGVSYFLWNLANKGEASSIIASGNTKLYGFGDNDLSESGRWYKEVLTARMDGSVVIGTVTPRGEQYGDGSQENGGASENGSGAGTNEASTVQADSGSCNAAAEYVNGWQSGEESFGQYSVTVNNTSEDRAADWMVEIEFAADVELSQFWNCNASVSGRIVTVTPADYNSVIEPKDSRGDIGLILSGWDLTVIRVEVK